MATVLSAAEWLMQAWRNARPLTELPADLRPATLSEGYDVQDAFMTAYCASNTTPIAGWKLGLASPAGLRAADITRGLVGQMPADRIHPNGATLTLPCAGPATIEFEIALILGRDVAPGQAPAQPLDAVSGAHLAYEIILSRFVNRTRVGLPSFAADNVGFEAFVLGPAIPIAHIAAALAEAAVNVDGTLRAESLTGDDCVDPATSLAHLFEHARERGTLLRAGQIVTTGTITRAFDIAVQQPVALSARCLEHTVTATLTTHPH